jgi:hypothetical protein
VIDEDVKLLWLPEAKKAIPAIAATARRVSTALFERPGFAVGVFGGGVLDVGFDVGGFGGVFGGGVFDVGVLDAALAPGRALFGAALAWPVAFGTLVGAWSAPMLVTCFGSPSIPSFSGRISESFD